MRFATFLLEGVEVPGVYVEGEGYYPLRDVLDDTAPISLLEYINNPVQDLSASLSSKNLKPISPDQITLCAPIPQPIRNIICLGKNYEDHAKEIVSTKLLTQDENFIPEFPVYFAKSAYPAVGHDSTIPLHEHFTKKVDYEAELAVIIGKKAFCIQESDVEDVIFGYTVLNDITDRDAQTRYGQWFYGKSLDGFCPMGPHIVTKDEIPFPVKLNIFCRVNGETRQNSNTSLLIYDIPRVISELSQGFTLHPGDIIATGTPGGVGHGMKPPRYLQKGDVVECEVEKVGILRTYCG